jgi:hypothetical protein
MPDLLSGGIEAVERSFYRVHDWDWGTNSRGAPIRQWDATAMGIRAPPGVLVRVPRSGYAIGDGYAALLLYTDGDQVVLKYTREDNVVFGYTLHVVGLCVAPELVARYDRAHRDGRERLPALEPGQPFAVTNGREAIVAIRDSGRFMDPRSRLDWW